MADGQHEEKNTGLNAEISTQTFKTKIATFLKSHEQQLVTTKAIR